MLAWPLDKFAHLRENHITSCQKQISSLRHICAVGGSDFKLVYFPQEAESSLCLRA